MKETELPPSLRSLLDKIIAGDPPSDLDNHAIQTSLDIHINVCNCGDYQVVFSGTGTGLNKLMKTLNYHLSGIEDDVKEFGAQIKANHPPRAAEGKEPEPSIGYNDDTPN